MYIFNHRIAGSNPARLTTGIQIGPVCVRVWVWVRVSGVAPQSVWPVWLLMQRAVQDRRQ